MMKKLFIHIGSHKTGSTYIQKILHENDELLLKDCGVLYPKTGKLFFGHHSLANIKMLNENYTEFKGLLHLEQIKKHDIIVISSENFEYLNAESIVMLLSLFDGYEIKIVYFYRNWNDLLFSMWQENIKHGSSDTYFEHVAKHIAFPFGSNILNLATPISNFASVVGLKNIIVCSYDLVLNDYDLFDFFFNLINKSAIIKHSIIKQNVAIDVITVECLRALNSLAIANNYKPGILVRKYLFEILQNDSYKHKIKLLFQQMHVFLLNTPNYNQCFAAQFFFNEFFNNFGECISHDVKLCRESLKSSSKVTSVISSDYLLFPESTKILLAFWKEIKLQLDGSECV